MTEEMSKLIELVREVAVSGADNDKAIIGLIRTIAQTMEAMTQRIDLLNQRLDVLQSRIANQ